MVIPILSFFTGAGLLDIGFGRSGFDSIWHNELIPWFVRGFENGMSTMGQPPHRSTIQNTSSITDISPEQISDEAFGGNRPDIFGAIGGPPCPDFSVAGKNKGGDGDRGSLSLTYVERILSLRPTFFLFENVTGLIRNPKHREFLWGLRRMLEDDYSVILKVVNSLDLGVPQDRERVLMIGFLRERLIGDVRDFPWPYDERYDGAKTRFDWPGVSSEPNPVRPEGTPIELMVGPLICDPGLIDVPNSEGFKPYSSKFGTLLEGDVESKGYKKLHRWRYSPTAAYGNNCVHIHPVEPRRLTVREAMRIQAIPDEYVLPEDMPLTHKFKTIGNGVPVGLAEAISGSIMRFIQEAVR